MTFALGYNPSLASHDETTGLHKLLNDNTKVIWRVAFPEGTYWYFSGYVQQIAPSAPVDDGLAADVTIRPTDAMMIV